MAEKHPGAPIIFVLFNFHCNIVFEIIALFTPQTLTRLVIEATLPLHLRHFTTCSLAATVAPDRKTTSMAFKIIVEAGQPWAPTRQTREVGSCHTDKISGQGKGTKGEMLITGCKAQTREEQYY